MEHVTDPVWRNESVQAALQSGDVGAIVRSVRQAQHLTLADVAARCGYSTSTLSRLETGRQPLRDVRVLRSLAVALGIPTRLLGVADTSVWNSAITRPTARVAATQRPDEEIDSMRRRTLLAGLTGLAGSALVSTPAHAASDSLAELEGVLIGPPAPPVPVAGALTRQVALARSAFQMGRYSDVAAALPELLRSAMATAAQTPGGRTAADLAEVYTLGTELLIKFGHDHLAWTTADRALQAAYTGDDVLAQAAARRTWGMVLRRGGRAETANRLVLDTATVLQPEVRHGPEHLSVYGSLLATAAYTAASGGDRDTARSLITEANDVARLVGEGANHRYTAFNPTGVDLYRISIARALGDPGTAIDIARHVNVNSIPTIERRGQFWTDVARSYHQWGKREQCYRALLAAERATPDEVRHRSHIQHMTHTLLSHPTATSLPGLRAFAGRVGVTA